MYRVDARRGLLRGLIAQLRNIRDPSPLGHGRAGCGCERDRRLPARVRLSQAWVLVEGQRVWLRSGMTGSVRIVYRYGAPLFEHLWRSSS